MMPSTSRLKNSIATRRFVLPNGLRVVHCYNPSTAMVAVDVLYDTGSRDESPELTGIAHLFEHLMFAGSANVPEFDKVLQDAGGSSNAWTSNDFTNFYDTLPAQNVETAFYLESDCMLALSFKQSALDIQRAVVIEEFKQRVLNQPFGDIYHRLRELVYGCGHPYSWPTIGIDPSHIERVTLDDIRNWFYAHYAPNNAILSVSGNVPFEKVYELAHKWFGPIPSRQIAPRPAVPKPRISQPVVERMYSERVSQTMIVKAYPMAPYGTPEYVAADAITDILAAGQASRMFRSLIAAGASDGLFASADASIVGSEHDGMLMLNAILTRDSEDDIRRALELLDDQTAALTREPDKGGASIRELERTFNRFETNFHLETLGYLALATELALAEYHNEDINTAVARHREVTLDQVRETAVKIFSQSPSATIIYSPK